MKRPLPDVDANEKYNVKEFCDKLHICRETIRKYTNLEVIVPIRVSSREIYYLGSEILLLHKHLTESSPTS